MSLTRRRIIQGTALAAGAVLLPTVIATAAFAQSVDSEELMQAGPLGDKVLGSEDARVVLIEYASMTCSHCARFHNETYDQFKKEYLDTGKVRLIFREFPLDPLAAAASMLARCAPEDKYFDVIDLMFEKQRAWAFTDNPLQALLDFAKQIGFTQQSFEQCLTNQELLDGVNHVRDRAAQKFGVSATPTFFLDGEKLEGGALSFEELSAKLEARL